MCTKTCKVSRNFDESPEMAGDLQASRKCNKSPGIEVTLLICTGNNFCYYPPPPNRVRFRTLWKSLLLPPHRIWSASGYHAKSTGWHRPGGPPPKKKSWLRRWSCGSAISVVWSGQCNFVIKECACKFCDCAWVEKYRLLSGRGLIVGNYRWTGTISGRL